MNDLKGGAQIVPRIIPSYKDTRVNNPFTTNDQKQIYNKEKAQKEQAANNAANNAANQVPTLFEFKINDTVVKYPDQKPKQSNDQGIYPLPFVPVTNPFYPIPGPLIPANGPYAFANNQIPIIKKYNISMSNVNGDLVKLSNLFEDVLPQINGITQKTLTTLSERKIINQYLRSLFIKHSDGENIDMASNSKLPSGRPDPLRSEMTNLLSHVKLMEINPYHFSRLTHNPYKTLPNNFLMFRSCYPIRLHTQYNSVQCAQDNIGLHIRIYQMKIIDILANRLGTNITKKDSDMWREIAFYEFMRENILKQNICPNFTMMYAWYVTYKSGIDFEKLKRLREDKLSNQVVAKDNAMIVARKLKDQIYNVLLDQRGKNGLVADYDAIIKYQIPANISSDEKEKLEKLKRDALDKKHTLLIDMHENNDPGQTTLEVFNYFNNDSRTATNANNSITIDELNKVDIGLSTNKCVVSVTEAPTQNLYDWGTRAYDMDFGPVKKMIHTGYHDIKVWQSVIFQMFAGMYTMYINKIAINEMSIQNNIFVKDLHRDENNVGFWKYIIKGIEFFVPNMGYLILIDSKFQELQDGLESTDFKQIKTLKYKHRIYGEIFEDDIDMIDEMNINNMINIFNENSFTSQEYTQFGGLKPPIEIQNMLKLMNKILITHRDEIKAKTTTSFDKSLLELLILTQYHFMHNKIGTIVKDIEKDQLIEDNISFKPGELVAHKITGTKDDAYTWALYLENNGIVHKILTTEHLSLANSKQIKLTKKDVSQGDILRTYGVVEQNYKANQKLADEDMLETYTINL